MSQMAALTARVIVQPAEQANDRPAGSPDRSSKLREQPAARDALSEVLRSVRLIGGVFLDARFTAPWSVLSQITAQDMKPFIASPAQVIGFHFIIEGKLLVAIEGEPPLEVSAGEIVLLPRNDVHMMATSLDLPPIKGSDLIQRSSTGGLARASHGGGGTQTHMICGFLASEDLYNPLIAALPRMLKLDVRQGLSGDWVEACVRYAASELADGRVASSSVMSRLSELLFVEAVRTYAATLGERDTGWLRGLADPQVGRALALIHHRIDASWTAETLAREVALSRSAFVDRFTSLVGMPPIRYLTVWRLRAAQLHLQETRKSIAQIAPLVGYESEEAFSRAFKREFGLSPARWRDRGLARQYDTAAA